MSTHDPDVSVAVVIFVVVTCVVMVFVDKLLKYFQRYSTNAQASKGPFGNLKIIKARKISECHYASEKLVSDCNDLSALGFDCEWVSNNHIKNGPVALVQLASSKGTCALYQLSILGTVTTDLKAILEDKNIIKLGVCPLDDAKRLFTDYGVQVNSCLDLRYLYPEGKGLAGITKQVLGVQLEKDWHVRGGNWAAYELSTVQKRYAALDALSAIEIYKTWLLNEHGLLNSSKTINYQELSNDNNVKKKIEKYLDCKFSVKSETGHCDPANSHSSLLKMQTQTLTLPPTRGYATRKSPLYHNCFMHAPDGELLCSCDQRKAEWYVEKGLAEVFSLEPYSIRLKFEPSGRAGNTNEGRFYTQLKQNCCVVCGEQESYLRHNVVPREYRKHFPSIMKDHQSHDVVLMCTRCHKLAALHDERLRQRLAEFCDAPIEGSKTNDLKEAKKTQNAAKALLTSGKALPAERKVCLEDQIRKFYGTDEINDDILLSTMDLETKVNNKFYEPHGTKVVDYFIKIGGGLLELEKLWRQHFLDTMKPKHLPALWSVTHNHERLAVRRVTKHVEPADLQLAGIGL